jgi:type IV secretory pathway VirD2 relaxase
MGLIERELGSALTTPVKRKANTTRKLRASRRQQAGRVASGTTEVMVKITGFGKGAPRVKAHLDYVSRNGKLDLENDRAEIFSGRSAVKELFEEWKQDFADARRHKNQRDTVHLVLSMPESTEPDAVHRASRKFCKATFGHNHEYVFALHTDEPHPHCHVTVKMRGFDGTRLNPRKEDLQMWREEFAQQLREQGVAAEATPRRARGVVRKAESTVVRHIELGDKTHAPRVSRVRAARVREAAQELVAQAHGAQPKHRPWEDAIEARQREVRRAWLAAAAALERDDGRLRFKGNEARNERPNYEQTNPERERLIQRAAALYQSDLEKAGGRASPGPLSGLRNLSSCAVVHDGNRAQMLLQSHAPDRVGQERAADLEVRRPGARDLGAAGEDRKVEGRRESGPDNMALASRIRAFVAALPEIETQRHVVKRNLAQTFTRQADFTLECRQPEGQSNPAAYPPRSDANRGERDIGADR